MRDPWYVVHVDEGVLSGPHTTKREAMDAHGIVRCRRSYPGAWIYYPVHEPSDSPDRVYSVIGRRSDLEANGFGVLDEQQGTAMNMREAYRTARRQAVRVLLDSAESAFWPEGSDNWPDADRQRYLEACKRVANKIMPPGDGPVSW